MTDKRDEQAPDDSQPSCDPSLSRGQFLTLVLKRSAAAGAILAAPRLVDSFLVPAAQAQSSNYTQPRQLDTPPGRDVITSPGQDVPTAPGSD